MEKTNLKHYLVHSKYELDIGTKIFDEYYILNCEQIKELESRNIFFKIISEIPVEKLLDFKISFENFKIGKKYNDNFSIFKFPYLKLIKKSSKFLFFKYKNYIIVINRKYYEKEML